MGTKDAATALPSIAHVMQCGSIFRPHCVGDLKTRRFSLKNSVVAGSWIEKYKMVHP